MSKLNIANLKKTIYYLKRNGLRDTYLAALERLQKNKEDAYTYAAPEKEVLKAQQERTEKLVEALEGVPSRPIFSILVPAYRTNADYLRAMIDSVLKQSFGSFELIIADASEDAGVERVVREYQDLRIQYLHLSENKGISENTNAALQAAKGEYIGLLDHDDLLTADALYEMAEAIVAAKEKGQVLELLYSDEDKCDETGQYYYEPHQKTDFNLDLILSNNYFCHFTVMKAERMKKLGFRREYDGAQDFDLVLRAVQAVLGTECAVAGEEAICHIPKVLYHWRCHRGSTAENPQSKQYAYTAGGRAIEDFIRKAGIDGEVISTKHLGFYQVHYKPDILCARKDIGAVGGKLLDKKGRIAGGIYDKDGTCLYGGLRKDFSGYMHRASLKQDVYAADVRLMRIRPELLPVVQKAAEEFAGGTVAAKSAGSKKPAVTAESFKKSGICKMAEDGRVALSLTGWKDDELCKLSIHVCEAIHKAGYRIVWDPEWSESVKSK